MILTIIIVSAIAILFFGNFIMTMNEPFDLRHYKNKKMAKDVSKQQIAILIQAYELVVSVARQMYDDADLKVWAANTHSLPAQEKITDAKKKLKDTFSIN